MEIVINIPEAFVSHYHQDRFGESLMRLKMDVHCVAGNYEKELCDMLFHAFKEAIPNWEGGN